MPLIQAIILAVVQGLTEFLPVSSTAHLVLFPWLLHWPDPGEAFDVALHAGTAAALLVDLRSLESHPVLRAVLERFGRVEFGLQIADTEFFPIEGRLPGEHCGVDRSVFAIGAVDDF